jgi:hypothetical protein
MQQTQQDETQQDYLRLVSFILDEALGNLPHTITTHAMKRQQKAKERMMLKISKEALISTIMKTVPLNILVKPDKKKLHVTTGDYGGHELGLNYPYSEINNGNIGEIRVGGLSIGLMYEGDFKSKNGRIRCLKSDKLLHYLESVASSLSDIVPSELLEYMRTLRVNVICFDFAVVILSTGSLPAFSSLGTPRASRGGREGLISSPASFWECMKDTLLPA